VTVWKSGLREICPRCEESILVRIEVPHEVEVAGTSIRIPKVQVEECRRCGFRSLTGREVRLFDVLFAPQYAKVSDLVAALKTAGYTGMFLRDDRLDSKLAFGGRAFVSGLSKELRELYLDNESSHVLDGLAAQWEGWLEIELPSQKLTVRLPKIGEGENGIVFDYQEASNSVLKLAKPRPYSREHIMEEVEITDFFRRHSIPVPAIVEADPFGTWVIKERLAGDSLAVIWDGLGAPSSPRHRTVKEAVRAFALRLIELFDRHPEAKTSISPNNIFVLTSGDDCRCLLVDTGPAPFHDYSGFDFEHYWEVVVPEKVRRYREVGYI
jgi:hypothetical protein